MIGRLNEPLVFGRSIGRWSRPLQEVSPLPTLQWITSADDPRMVIYRHKDRRNHAEFERQVRDIAGRLLHKEAAAMPRSWRQLPCPVKVHYSWDCLQRLLDARRDGREVKVESVLLSNDVDDEQRKLAGQCCEQVLVADRELIEAEFAFEGTTQRRSVNYVVAYPKPQPIALARLPVLVLDGLGAAQNIGQILRTAFHFGVTSILASRSVWNSLGGRACRVSMGWLYFMDFFLGEPMVEALKELRERGCHIYCAEDHFAEAVKPHGPSGKRNWALIVGHEQLGVSKECIAMSDTCISVPSRQGESLNVAHAAAICLYELSRHMEEP
ncbi:23S rRNA (guanosine-2'-O-)-methyltransferase RlmB (23S rRNA (guanosine2251 2'-O)-methyltransferase) (23S rRNA Gm2251 2'-O-methyltransferase) [Durusdinium trenchii]|uniref:23S rRNA (Guanosine-2'-O-)-methyltransferase RlmB (23S rRNA (Guanosine2251 2'-O)-methyltransferase) (23S rRNA Gm2251 2'-O-methyltransferase) n=1 Tax=Durusdinium trenchii TaxID=1381693 RepID=A0ABP0IM62_9DINO